jgi:hypothetical protein
VFSGKVRKARGRASLVVQLAKVPALFGKGSCSAVVAEIYRSHQRERITVVHESFFVDIAETMLVDFLVAVLKIARMLQGQAKFDVVFVVMQYCMVGPGATCTLLQLLQFWHLQV